MGADFLMTALVIDAKRKPDWAAARAAIEAMTADDLITMWDKRIDMGEGTASDEDVPEAAEEYRQTLLYVVSYVEQALSGDNRLVAQIQIRGADVYVIGGESWGDAPEGTEEFALFLDSPAYEAAGFEHQVFVPATEESSNG